VGNRSDSTLRFRGIERVEVVKGAQSAFFGRATDWIKFSLPRNILNV